MIAAFDFFTVPTVTFQVLYCFFVIEHGRRKILHFNVTRHPTAEWVVQQLREAFPEVASYRYVILDRDAKFDGVVVSFLQGAGLKLKRTSVQSPWQNGIAERWVGSCRRELADLGEDGFEWTVSRSTVQPESAKNGGAAPARSAPEGNNGALGHASNEAAPKKNGQAKLS